MRAESARVRGEPGRVAARVRVLLTEHGDGVDGASDSHPPDQDEVVRDGPAHDGGAVARLASSWQRWAARVPVRLDPGRRTAVAVGVAVLVVAIVTGAWVAAAKPRSLPVSASVPSTALTATPVGTARPSSSAPPAGATTAPSVGAAELVVDVAGKVRHPALYRLAPGSRVDDALRAAGGALHGVDLSSLNLAARVVDGQQVLVGAAGAGGAAGLGGAGGVGAGAGPLGARSGSAASSAAVNLNTATLEQLQTLPGVGPVLGQHILDYRSQHGTFTSVDQLNDVAGIGEVKFAALRPLVTV